MTSKTAYKRGARPPSCQEIAADESKVVQGDARLAEEHEPRVVRVVVEGGAQQQPLGSHERRASPPDLLGGNRAFQLSPGEDVRGGGGAGVVREPGLQRQRI